VSTRSDSVSAASPQGGAAVPPPPGGGAFRAFKRIVAGVDALTFWAIVAAMAAMSILVSLQVVMRYFFSSSIDSADELSRLFFVWAIFLAIPHGVKHGVHVGIDLCVRMLPLRGQETLFRVMAGLSALLMVMVMIGGWVAMWRPIEVFLYDWWPIRAEARLYQRLATMPVRIEQTPDVARAGRTQQQRWPGRE